MHLHTCIHTKAHSHHPHRASSHQLKMPLPIQFIVGEAFLGAGDDGVFVGFVLRTTLQKSSSHFLEAAVSQGYKWNQWPSRKPKYKGHHEWPEVIHAKNDLPWAPRQAHLFRKPLLSCFCKTDPVLGDYDGTKQAQVLPYGSVTWQEEGKDRKDCLIAFASNILYYNIAMVRSPHLKTKDLKLISSWQRY